MNNKIFGIDLGTHSYGWALRDENLENNQLVYAGVIRFDSGVGTDKSGGVFTYNSLRTKDRGIRNRYQAEKYRKFELLKWLVQYDMCPLTMEELYAWKRYVKPSRRDDLGESRRFPKENEKFIKWLFYDFNYNTKSITPSYNNIYELRSSLTHANPENTFQIKHKIGRALYHIAHHRGFKSSKKIKSDEEKDDSLEIKNLSEIVLNGAENKKAKEIDKLLSKHNVKTISEAFASELSSGRRVRKDLQQYAIRTYQKAEAEIILKNNGFRSDSIEFKNLINAIFFQRKLKTQKGNIGKCTLEKNKTRCYISHYSFEEFSIREFLNNIKANGISLPKEIREDIYQNLFLKTVKSYLKFHDIKEFLIKKGHYTHNDKFNYKDKQTIGACPISSYLQKVFGDNWRDIKLITNQTRKNCTRTNKEIIYTIEDVWHTLLYEDEFDRIKEIALNKWKLSESQVTQLINCSKKFEQGFSSLSLNAINKILPFLREGLDNLQAKLLANIPKIIGQEVFNNQKENIITFLDSQIDDINFEKETCIITNSLIMDWKNADYEEKVGYKDTSYIIDDFERQKIEEKLIAKFGNKTWNSKSEQERNIWRESIFEKFQFFFKDEKRSYIKLPTVKDALKNYISINFLKELPEEEKDKKINLIYHPSEVEFYSKETIRKNNKIQLGSPKHEALKNPKIMRTLHVLRNHLNNLLYEGIIDEETIIVIELARELNDINKAWAIEQYQNQQEAERKKFIEILKEFQDKKLNVNIESSLDQEKLKFAIEQLEMEDNDYKLPESSYKLKDNQWEEYQRQNNKKIEKYIEKIKLWKEQNFKCIYTGKSIPLSKLFEEGQVDIEHTIPYSISFDNSLRNKTVCDSSYNKNIKGNKIPFELKDDYENILNNIKHWIDKVKFLEDRIEFWKTESKKANGDKERKDKAIREKNLWKLEYDYWNGKVERFMLKEVTTKWINSQLNDTQIITKYAYHFLKTVFYNVRAEKGTITADFRKILNIQQQIESEKNRMHHSHHAIDAAVLTLIPSSPHKQDILSKAGEYWKTYHKQYHGYKPYPTYNETHVLSIKDNILIDFKAKNNLFSRFVKIERKKGKKVPKTIFNTETGKKEILLKKDINGNIEFRKHRDGNFILKHDINGHILKDEYGGKIPEPEYKKSKGDGFRGGIYQDTFYGRIGCENKIVLRKPIKDVLKDPKNIVDDFVKLNINNELVRIRNEEQAKKDGLLENVDTNIYQTDKDGNRAKDANGNFIIFRHVRCYIPNIKAIAIKENLFPSKKNTHVLAQHEDVSLAAIYEFIKENKEKDIIINKDLVALNPINILELKKTIEINKKEDFFEKQFTDKNKNIYNLKYVIKKKDKVIFYNKDKFELKDLSYNQLRNRLFLISGIEQNKAGKKITTQNPFYSMEMIKNLPTKVSELRLNETIGEYKLSQGNWKFIVEGYDFEINSTGKVEWKF